MAQIKYNLGTVGGIAVTELWSGTSGKLVGLAAEGTVALNDDITNYKLLVFEFKASYNNGKNSVYYSGIITPSRIINLINDNDSTICIDFCWGYSDTVDFYELQVGSTTRTLKVASKDTICTKILGLN